MSKLVLCTSLIGLVLGAIFQMISWLRWVPLAPEGTDIQATLLIAVRNAKEKDAERTLTIGMQGKILRVRFCPVGRGIEAYVQTTAGMYEFPLGHEVVDWDCGHPVKLTFQYAEGVQFRKQVSDRITNLTALGPLGASHQASMGCPKRPGDVSEISLYGTSSVCVNTTERFRHTATAGNFEHDQVIEIHLSP